MVFEPLRSATTAADQSHEDQNDGDHEKDVDEPSHGGVREKTEKPQEKQDDGDGVEQVGLRYPG